MFKTETQLLVPSGAENLLLTSPSDTDNNANVQVTEGEDFQDHFTQRNTNGIQIYSIALMDLDWSSV